MQVESAVNGEVSSVKKQRKTVWGKMYNGFK